MRVLITISGRPNLLSRIRMILGTLFGELSNPWTVSRAIPLRESCNLIRLSELVKSQRFVDSWYCDLNPCHSSGSPEKLINFLPYDCLASNFSIALSLLETCGSGTGSLLLTGGNRFGLLATTLLGEIGECCVTWTRSCNSVGSFRGSSWYTKLSTNCSSSVPKFWELLAELCSSSIWAFSSSNSMRNNSFSFSYCHFSSSSILLA